MRRRGAEVGVVGRPGLQFGLLSCIFSLRPRVPRRVRAQEESVTDINEVRVELGWPPRNIAVNRSKGRAWQYSYRERKDYYKEGYFATLEVLGGNKFAKASAYRLIAYMHPPDHRRRDLDNITAALKHALDGVCRALEIDDSEIVEACIYKSSPKPGGRIVAFIIANNT
jgi:Holliday junction resolvase RusA-like endonuclease